MKRKLLLFWYRVKRYCVPCGYIYVPDTGQVIGFYGLKDKVSEEKKLDKSKKRIVYYDSDSLCLENGVWFFIMCCIGALICKFS